MQNHEDSQHNSFVDFLLRRPSLDKEDVVDIAHILQQIKSKETNKCIKRDLLEIAKTQNNNKRLKR